MFGQSAFNVTNNYPPAPVVPPFPAGAADNGLSVDPVTGRIVLGNGIGSNLADLLSNREITMQDFLLQFVNNGGRKFALEPAIGLYSLGDIDEVDGGARIVIDNAQIFASAPGGNMMLLSKLINQYSIGDINNTLNGSRLIIDDQSLLINFTDLTGVMLSLDRSMDEYSIGDAAAGNGLQLFLDNANNVADIHDITGQMLALDRNGGFYAIGDIGGLTNGMCLILDDSGLNAVITNVDGPMLLLDRAGLYQIGDMSFTFNGNEFSVDDANNVFRFTNPATDSVIEINGQTGFTGTVSPVNSITVEGGIVTAVS